MILTVTPNPLLERRLSFYSIKSGTNNRSKNEFFYAGGKGINVSRQLNKLGIKNLALTFLGGHNGKLLRRTFENEGINFNSVSTKSETRYAAVAIEEQTSQMTSYFSPNSDILDNEIDEFISKMDKAIQNSSIVLFAGSAPNESASKIFTEGIALANKYDKISFIDTYGTHLKECISLSPFAIHNNINEVENSLNIKLDDEKKKSNFLNSLYENNVKMSFITDGEKELYSSKFDFIFKTTPPKVKCINSTGSGDAFTAGIIYGLEKSLVYDEFLKLAVALGSLNSETLDAGNVELNAAKRIIDQVNVLTVGKKMKIIDDSPNY